MANALYNSGSAYLLSNFDWVGQDFDAYLIDTTAYTVNLTSHTSMSNVPGGARIAGPIALASKAIVDGAADAANITFPAVVGPTCQAIIIAKHTGADATDTLVVWIDNSTGLPITPNGGDIINIWDDGVYRIFKP